MSDNGEAKPIDWGRKAKVNWIIAVVASWNLTLDREDPFPDSTLGTTDRPLGWIRPGLPRTRPPIGAPAGADGSWQRYQNDAAGQLAKVKDDAGTTLELYSYDFGIGIVGGFAIMMVVAESPCPGSRL